MHIIRCGFFLRGTFQSLFRVQKSLLNLSIFHYGLALWKFVQLGPFDFYKLFGKEHLLILLVYHFRSNILNSTFSVHIEYNKYFLNSLMKLSKSKTQLYFSGVIQFSIIFVDFHSEILSTIVEQVAYCPFGPFNSFT